MYSALILLPLPPSFKPKQKQFRICKTVFLQGEPNEVREFLVENTAPFEYGMITK